MTEEQWIEASETIQSAASRRGLISPLDVLILSYKRSQSHSPSMKWRASLYELHVRWKKFMIGLKQDKVSIKKGSIIFFPIEPTHLNQMIPVARLLADKDLSFHFVTSRIPIFYSLKSQELQVHLVTGSNPIPADDIGIMKLNDLKPVLSKFPTPFIDYLERSRSEVVRLSAGLKILLEYFRPAYVFIGNDLTWEGRLMTRVSKEMNFRTGMIQHGLLGREIYNRLHIVDDFYIYGQAFSKILKEDGLVGSNLVVTGPPYLDQRNFDSGTVNAKLREAFDLKGSFVLVALSGTGDRTSALNYRQALTIISHLINNHPDIDFVIKLHRKESIDAYATFSPRQQFRIVDRNRASGLPHEIFDWLEGCSCLITGTSTVAYEAMLYNIPIISVDPLREYRGVNFVDEGIVNVVHTYSELAEALVSVNGMSVDYVPFITNIFGELDGNAARRVVDRSIQYAAQ